MSKVISIRVPDNLAEALEAAQVDPRAALEAALDQDQAAQNRQQIDRITIRIDMR